MFYCPLYVNALILDCHMNWILKKNIHNRSWEILGYTKTWSVLCVYICVKKGRIK